ncbi:MAG TPA: ubiquitin-conjugating enzyme E2, partial [Candidatus Methanoperedens sp.]
MSVRDKRLANDFRQLRSLKSNSPFIDFQSFGSPPERYIVTLTCKGLEWDEKSKKPLIRESHKFEIYLPWHYPTGKPFIKWITPIFHPNILPPEYEKNPGFVCIGAWAPSIRLRDLVVKIAEMIQYKNYEATFDRLNVEAANWTLQNKHLLPIDKREIIAPEPEIFLGSDDEEVVILKCDD